jgi:small GTP-binding protein
MGTCCVKSENEKQSELKLSDFQMNASKEFSIIQNEKRGISIPTQSFVKKLNNSFQPKKENLNKISSKTSTNAMTSFVEPDYSKFHNRTTIKILLLGDPGVGKSSFVIRFVNSKFETYYVVSIGTECYTKKNLNFNGITYTLEFIVSSGDPLYKQDITKVYEDVDFFLMFYDVTSFSSFENIKKYLNDIKDYIFFYKNKIPNVIIVGNKCDHKDKIVKMEDVNIFCMKENLGIKAFEVSVKANTNIPKLINLIVESFHVTAHLSQD